MAGTKRKFVGLASFGEAPKVVLDRVETMRFVFYNFKDLEEQREEKVETSSLEAFGYLWKFLLYPKGELSSSTNTEHISCFLKYAGDAKYKPAARFTFRCKNDVWEQDTPCIFDDKHSYGPPDYSKREDVLTNYLDDDGSLVIDVDMQIAVDKENDAVWYPKLNIPIDVLTQLYHSSSDDDTNTSDAVFDVDGDKLPAHTSILSVRAPTLFELIKENNTNVDGVVVVPIPNMESNIFEGVLKFIYCVEIPTIEDKATATKHLLAANRLGIVDLKMYVESMIVEKFLDTSNAAEMLILADSHSCPLLKEAAIKLYDNNNDVVMESEGWSQLEESPRLLVELLRFAYKVKQQQSSTGSDNHNVVDDVTNLDVTSLRERLLEADLDIDGNQEILMERLKNHISPPSSDSTRNNNVSSLPAAAAGALAAVVAIPQRQLRPRRQPRR